MSWKESIRPIQKTLVLRESDWRKTIHKNGDKGDPGKAGKDFSFDEHKHRIEEIIVKHVARIKSDLKVKFHELGEHEKKELRGETGGDGSKWHIFEEDPSDSEGKDGDLCLSQDGHIFHKENGRWTRKLSIKGKESQYIGGGLSEARALELIAANTTSASGDVLYFTSSNLTVTNQTHVIVKGASAVTISLKALATATTPVQITNKSTQNCSVVVSGGGLISENVDDSTFIIVPGNTYIFIPETGVIYHVA